MPPPGTSPACTAWLHRGIDGIDLISATRPVPPLGPHGHAGIELGALHALIAEHGEDVILTGGGTARDRAALAAHLHEDWLHVTRDDRLVVTPWRPEPLRAAITDAYALRDPVGAPAGWTLATAALSAPAEWGDLDAAALERRHDAAAALMLALPGTAYLHLGEAVGLRQAGDVAAAVRATAAAVAAQKGRPDSRFERYRRGLRLRDELRLGTGPLGWVDSPAGTLAFLNREVLVLVNARPRGGGRPRGAGDPPRQRRPAGPGGRRGRRCRRAPRCGWRCPDPAGPAPGPDRRSGAGRPRPHGRVRGQRASGEGAARKEHVPCRQRHG